MTDIADTAINGVPNYDMYVMSMFEAMEFRGKPLSTWEQELNFNELGDRIDHNELKAYNLDFVNIIERYLSKKLDYIIANNYLPKLSSEQQEKLSKDISVK